VKESYGHSFSRHPGGKPGPIARPRAYIERQLATFAQGFRQNDLNAPLRRN
jgi:cytochrome c553